MQTEARIAELFRREAAHRKALHGRLANQILGLGVLIQPEQLSYKAFQKRFGRSISVWAPKLVLSILTRKAESAGGQVIEFSTRTTALSQVCVCGEKHKKRLSERVHACECGVTAQRDLFSAYLARFVEDDDLQVFWPVSLGQVRNRSCGRLGNRQSQNNLQVEGLVLRPLAAIPATRVRAGRPRKLAPRSVSWTILPLRAWML